MTDLSLIDWIIQALAAAGFAAFVRWGWMQKEGER